MKDVSGEDIAPAEQLVSPESNAERVAAQYSDEKNKDDNFTTVEADDDNNNNEVEHAEEKRTNIPFGEADTDATTVTEIRNVQSRISSNSLIDAVIESDETKKEDTKEEEIVDNEETARPIPEVAGNVPKVAASPHHGTHWEHYEDSRVLEQVDLHAISSRDVKLIHK